MEFVFLFDAFSDYRIDYHPLFQEEKGCFSRNTKSRNEIKLNVMKTWRVILWVFAVLLFFGAIGNLSRGVPPEVCARSFIYAIAFAGGAIYLGNRIEQRKQEKEDEQKWKNNDGTVE